MEKDDELKGSGNSYDFGARMYDSRLGRWLALDPLANKFPYESPYNFAGNSPVLFVDPDGKVKIIHYLVTDKKGNTSQITIVDEDYIEYESRRREIGDDGYSFWSDVADDFSWSSKEPSSGYTEKDVAHDVEITKTISLEDLQLIDKEGNITLDFSKAKIVSEVHKERIPEVTHFMDGWPGVTFYGSGDLDFGTIRKSSSMVDVTDLIEIAKFVVATAGPVSRADYTISRDLGGALTLQDKATTGNDNLTGGGSENVESDSTYCNFCKKNVHNSQTDSHYTDYEEPEPEVE